MGLSGPLKWASMDTRLLKPREVDLILRYPAGRAEKLARRALIPCVTLPDGEIRFTAETVERLMKEATICPKSEGPNSQAFTMIQPRRGKHHA